MGARRPENIPLRERYRLGATVGLMLANGWAALAICRGCQLQMIVRLDWIARINGPDVTLWNRTAACRRLGCKGVAEFHAMAPGMTRFEYMAIDNRLRDDGWAGARRRQAAQAKAAKEPSDDG